MENQAPCHHNNYNEYDAVLNNILVSIHCNKIHRRFIVNCCVDTLLTATLKKNIIIKSFAYLTKRVKYKSLSFYLCYLGLIFVCHNLT